jgi:hypothetical protein
MKAKNMKQKTPEPQIIYRDPPKPSWARGHYHCKSCGSEIECLATLHYADRSLFWPVENRRIGVCKCGQILVEREHGKLKWLWQRA